MENLELIISGLKEKIQLLMKKFEIEKTKNAELSLKLMQLEKIIGDKEAEIESLHQKIERLTLGVAFTGSSVNSHEAKIKINRIVREIDQCIALLNR